MRWALILTLWAGIASAAPDVSPRPMARVEPARFDFAAVRPVTRPLPDTATSDTITPEAPTRPVARPGIPAVMEEITLVSLRPLLRPKRVEQEAMARKRKRLAGAVCNDPDIQGTVVGAVPDRGACGIDAAVRVREVAGIGLTQQALMNCDTAKALKTWVTRSAKPELRSIGGGLSRLKVAAHYACRTRNNLPGARISEHGKGRAIDISAFILRDGSQLTVLNNWSSGRRGSRAMRAMHKGACGPFGTVLGPNSDRFHRDHFHFDTARYRSGPFCR